MDISNKIIWLNHGYNFWDQTLLEELLKDLPETERKIIVIPGTINNPTDVNAILSQYTKVLVIITSDEENKFDVNQLNHPDMLIYLTYPNLDKHRNVNRFLPIGYPPDIKLATEHKKDLDWFFAGQINHDSRRQLIDVLRPLNNGKLLGTDGFAQGFEHQEYYDYMSRTKLVPSPGGPLSPDSFRLYEALETGAIPIPDNPDFWHLLFGEVPFPTIRRWDSLPELINNLKDRSEQNNICQAWWMQVKRQLRYNLEEDLGIKPEGITVLIPTSPIESHPSTEIIEQTIQSVRERLPDSEIVLMIDGVRDEQADKRQNYTEYIRRLLWKYRGDNLYPLLFEDFQHQANMARAALRHVRTPYVLYVEHDTPLSGEIPFEQMVGAIQTKQVNLIRFHFEAAIHPEHKHLMLDVKPRLINGVPLLRTAQWSQRPHLASTDFYRRIIDDYFPSTGRTMIEDKIYGVLENAWFTKGTAGWSDFKVWMYAPEGDIKRSLNLDGRGSESKYEMRFE